MQVARHLKFCQRRSDLLDTLHAATLGHAKAVHAMSRRVFETITDAEFGVEQMLVRSALSEVNAARDALLEHQRVHGC